jgi:hypothetical protein
VGHDDEGDADLVLDVHQLELGLLAQLLVQRAERLVEQQQLGLLATFPMAAAGGKERAVG